MKIMIAEDTKDLNRNITLFLEQEGYKTESVFDGAQVLEYLKKECFDCIILDVMMPKMDGFTVLKELRRRNIMTPVLILTARAELNDKVYGLDSGADDYLSKPFAFRELLARIRSLIRRNSTLEKDELSFKDIQLDSGDFSLSCISSVRLSVKEYEMMRLLMLNPDIELSTEYMLEHIWKTELEVQADKVWLYISYLRGKLILISSSVTIDGEKGGSFRLREICDEYE